MKTLLAICVIGLLVGILFYKEEEQGWLCSTDTECEQLPMNYSLPSRWLGVSGE